MATIRDHNQVRSTNARGHLAGEFWRCGFITVADQNQSWAGNRSKAWARIRTAQDRLLLAQVSLNASGLGHLPQYALKRFIAVSVAMHVKRKRQSGYLRVATFLGEPHQHAAAF